MLSESNVEKLLEKYIIRWNIYKNQIKRLIAIDDRLHYYKRSNRFKKIFNNTLDKRSAVFSGANALLRVLQNPLLHY